MDQIQICINGFDTYYFKHSDTHGNYFAIAIPPSADKSISDICGTSISGQLITEIDYMVIDEVRFIKAYF